MHIKVYSMRRNGQRLSAAAHARGDSVTFGWLEFQEIPHEEDYGHRMWARLIFSETQREDLILPLHRAHLRITHGVIHLRGVEYHSRGKQKSKTYSHRQTWMCTNDDELARSILARVRPCSIAGYDQEDELTPADLNDRELFL